MPGALLVLLLAVCCGAVSLGAALIAEIPVRVGAGGGAFPAALVAPVLGLPSRRRRPLRGRAPGPRRPLLAPLVGLLAALTLRGARAGSGRALAAPRAPQA